MGFYIPLRTDSDDEAEANSNSSQDDSSSIDGDYQDAQDQHPIIDSQFKVFGEEFDSDILLTGDGHTEDTLLSLPLLEGQKNSLDFGSPLALAETFDTPRPTDKPKNKPKKKKSSSKKQRARAVTPADDDEQPIPSGTAFTPLHQRKQAIRESSAHRQRPTPTSAKMVTQTRKTAAEQEANNAAVAQDSDATRMDDTEPATAAVAAASAKDSSASPSTDVAAGAQKPSANGQNNTSKPPARATESSASGQNGEQQQPIPRKKAATSGTGEKNPETSGGTKRSSTDEDLCACASKKAKTKEQKEIELLRFMEKVGKRDGKMNSDRRLKKLTEVRKEMFILRSNNNDLQVECDDNKKKVLMLVKRNEKLKDELEELKKKGLVSASRAKVKLLRMCTDQRDKARAISHEQLWRICKFISCAEEEDTAAEYVLGYMKVPHVKKNEETKWSWVETYKKLIKKALFQRRNYVTAELKKAASKYFLDKGKTMPPVSMILKCATRSIDMANKEEMDFFLWYWEQVLPRMVGKANWSTEVKYYTTISGAKTSEDEPKRLVTFSSEAMIVLIWENNMVRWPTLHEWSAKPENKGLTQPNMNGIHTVTDQGQNEWGGWSPEGLDNYNKYCKQVKAGRKSPNALQLEKVALQQLRIKNDIDQPTHEQQIKVNRQRRRRKKNADKGQTIPDIPTKRVVKTMVSLDDDSSDDEQDGKNNEDDDDDTVMED